MFDFCSVECQCAIFHKLAMQGVRNVKIRSARGVPFMEDNPRDWIILAKNAGCLCLCSLAPPELIASIQNVKAIEA